MRRFLDPPSRAPWMLALAIALFSVAPVLGQYAAGDVVIVDARSNTPARIWSMDRAGKVSTVVRSLPFLPQVVIPSPDNRGVLVAGNLSGTQGVVARVMPSGTIVSLTNPAHFLASMCIDHTGDVYLGDLVGRILRFRPPFLTRIYFSTRLQGASGLTVDPDTGDLLIADGATSLHRLNIRGVPILTNVVSCLPQGGEGLQYDPDTQRLVGSFADGLFSIDLSFPSVMTLRRGAPFGHVGKLARDPSDGWMVVPNTRPVDAVYRYHAATGRFTTLATLPPAKFHLLTGATVAGSRHLAGLGPARTGNPYRLRVSSPAEPGASYVVGMSFGRWPGISTPDGRTIWLHSDALLGLSQAHAFFQDFRGRLDSQGEATATLHVPPWVSLHGLRVFAAVVTIVGGRIVTISHTLGITIE